MLRMISKKVVKEFFFGRRGRVESMAAAQRDGLGVGIKTPPEPHRGT